MTGGGPMGEQSAETADIDEALAPLLEDGFKHYEHEHFKPGVRVRNAGQQYPKARQFGTAEVVRVLRKEGSWEQTYGRLNLEVLVRYDEHGRLGWWQDYRTALAEGCWHCDGAGCDMCATPTCNHNCDPANSEARRLDATHFRDRPVWSSLGVTFPPGQQP